MGKTIAMDVIYTQVENVSSKLQQLEVLILHLGHFS